MDHHSSKFMSKQPTMTVTVACPLCTSKLNPRSDPLDSIAHVVYVLIQSPILYFFLVR